MRKAIEYLLLKDQYSRKEVADMLMMLADRLDTGEYSQIIVHG